MLTFEKLKDMDYYERKTLPSEVVEFDKDECCLLTDCLKYVDRNIPNYTKISTISGMLNENDFETIIISYNDFVSIAEYVEGGFFPYPNERKTIMRLLCNKQQDLIYKVNAEKIEFKKIMANYVGDIGEL